MQVWRIFVEGVVGEAGEGVDAAELDGWGVGSEFVDGLGEAFGVEAGGFAVGAGLVDALAAVGDDEGDEGSGSGDHSEGEFHQVEECLGVEFRGAVDFLEVEQYYQSVKNCACDQDGGGEGEGPCPADPRQLKLSFVRRSRPLPGCHEDEDKARGSAVATSPISVGSGLRFLDAGLRVATLKSSRAAYSARPGRPAEGRPLTCLRVRSVVEVHGQRSAHRETPGCRGRPRGLVLFLGGAGAGASWP
ncbi:hypothetical protein ACFUTV_40295 [Streptomyces sp. NPDC057298]|uniref:hypothetical protein n=1 Tax=Streptomyces sp. NPDC057298 TaxID=3346091 RepID=UPI0036316F4A